MLIRTNQLQNLFNSIHIEVEVRHKIIMLFKLSIIQAKSSALGKIHIGERNSLSSRE